MRVVIALMLSVALTACTLNTADVPDLTPNTDNVIYVTATSPSIAQATVPSPTAAPTIPPTPAVDPSVLLQLADTYETSGYLKMRLAFISR